MHIQMDSHDIPPNILGNILVRFNVKTLGRFKRVSRTWFTFISSPTFQDYHYSKWQHNFQILFRTPLRPLDFPAFTYIFASLPMSLQPKPAPHTTFIARVDGPIKLVLPSCWGLVCFATKARIYLYNPTTKRLLPLPPSPNLESSVMCGFGFGYIKSKKCYRVVQLMYGEFYQRIECSVLQVDRRAKESELSWMVLKQACPYFVEEFSLPAFSEGTIYWKIRPDRNWNNYEIMGFNIEEYKFCVISYPSDWIYSPCNWKDPPSSWTQLMNADGKLYMVQNFISHIIIWIRRNQEWEGLGAIDLKGIEIDMTKIVEIIYFNKDIGIILGSYEGLFHLYDFKKRICTTPNHIPFTVHGLAIYSESLFQLGHSY